MISGCHLSPLGLAECTRLQQTLVWCPCGLVHLVHSRPVPGPGTELHRRLEEVHVKPHIVIKPFQTLERSSGGVPVVAHQTAYHIAILLLHMTAIVLLVGARTCKGALLLAAIGIEALVDEFAF